MRACRLPRRRDKLVAALNRVAWLRATHPDAQVRDAGKAVTFATRACELTEWKLSSLLDTLGAAHAEAGDLTAAIEWVNKAIKLAPESAHAELRTRIELYGANKPYREQPTED